MKNNRNYHFSIGKKQNALNIISAALSFVVGFGVSFFLSPYLLKTLGREAYSFYPLSTNITNMMTAASSALNSMACRFITISLINKNNEDADKYYASTLFVDFIYSVVLIVASAIFLALLPVFLKVPAELLTSVRLLFAFTISAAIVNIVATVFGVATFATNRIDLRSIREIACSLLRMLLFFLLYGLLPANLCYVGVVALAISVLSMLVQMFFTKKLLPSMSFSRRNVSKIHVKRIFMSSLWVTINSIGNTFLSGFTLIVLNRAYGPEIKSGVSIAMTIPTLLGGVITTIVGVFYPYITKAVADEDYPALKEAIKKAQLYCGVFSCAVIAVFSVFSESFYRLWVPTEDASALTEATFYTLAPYLPTSLFWVATYVNTATNDLKVPAIAMSVFGVVNVALQVLLAFFKVHYLWIVFVCSTLQILFNAIFLPLYTAKTISGKWFDFYVLPLKILAITILVFGFAKWTFSLVTIDSWAKFLLVGGATGLAALGIYILSLWLLKEGRISSIWQIKK